MAHRSNDLSYNRVDELCITLEIRAHGEFFLYLTDDFPDPVPPMTLKCFLSLNNPPSILKLTQSEAGTVLINLEPHLK